MYSGDLSAKDKGLFAYSFKYLPIKNEGLLAHNDISVPHDMQYRIICFAISSSIK